MFAKEAISLMWVLVIINCRHVKCEENVNTARKIAQGIEIAKNTALTFLELFDSCVETTMANSQYSLDDMQKFVLSPARTTVGFGPKFTANRKFFANLLSTTQFMEMLAKDKRILRKQLVEKMKYCDSAVMDPDLLRDFYDREVDQSKI